MKIERTLLLIILFICLCSAIYNVFHKEYRYIDMNNSIGIAEKCYMNDKGLFCETGKKVVEVKQFGRE